MATIGTVNEAGESVDLYAPRKCHVTNSLIASNDYSSVQVAIANVDTTGVWDGTTTIFCVAGFVRSQARSDHAINHLAIKKGIIRIKSAKPKKMKKSMKKKVQRQPAAAPQKGRPAPSQKKGQAPVSQKDAKPQGGKKGQARKTRA